MFLRVIRSPILINYQQCLIRGLATGTAGSSTGKTSPAKTASSQFSIPKDVPGLTTRCVKEKSQPLGPGASTTGEYKVPEYYCYDKTSYHEAEIEMLRYRCPQPSAQRKE